MSSPECKCGAPVDVTTCGHCNRSWCDRCYPTHGPRCPFEYDHEYTPGHTPEPWPEQPIGPEWLSPQNYAHARRCVNALADYDDPSAVGEVVKLLDGFWQRFANTRKSSPHRIIDGDDAAAIRQALARLRGEATP